MFTDTSVTRKKRHIQSENHFVYHCYFAPKVRDVTSWTYVQERLIHSHSQIYQKTLIEVVFHNIAFLLESASQNHTNRWKYKMEVTLNDEMLRCEVKNSYGVILDTFSRIVIFITWQLMLFFFSLTTDPRCQLPPPLFLKTKLGNDANVRNELKDTYDHLTGSQKPRRDWLKNFATWNKIEQLGFWHLYIDFMVEKKYFSFCAVLKGSRTKFSKKAAVFFKWS